MLTNEPNTGYVYVLTNQCMPGLVKIGMTERENLEQRMRELYSTGVPVAFDCAFAAKVNKSDCKRIEHALHRAFAPNRVNATREFFRIDPEQAIVILELFHHEDVTQEVAEEIDSELTEDDKIAKRKAKNRRPPLNFYEMGLQKGDILTWIDDPSITVSIASARKVLYNDEERSLSDLSAQLKGGKAKYIIPTPYWLYNDRPLNEYYDNTYPMELE